MINLAKKEILLKKRWF